MKKIAIFVVYVIIIVGLFGTKNATAQFSKAVVVLKGTVRNGDTQTPHSVNVSVREVGNKALELTASRSNAETGNYLVIVKPQTKYWLHIEGEDIETRDILVETPAAGGKTVNMVQDFLVTVLPKHSTAKK
jgi:hypothetical protein